MPASSGQTLIRGVCGSDVIIIGILKMFDIAIGIKSPERLQNTRTLRSLLFPARSQLPPPGSFYIRRLDNHAILPLLKFAVCAIPLTDIFWTIPRSFRKSRNDRGVCAEFNKEDKWNAPAEKKPNYHHQELAHASTQTFPNDRKVPNR